MSNTIAHVALAAAVLAILYMLAGVSDNAMRICQLSHSFDTCYSTLNR